MAARNVARPVEIDAGTRQQVEAFARSRSLPHGLVLRAKLILLACDGMRNIEIAETIGLSRESVGKWRARFIERGLNGLYDELRPGRPRQIEEERIAELINKTLRSTPRGHTQWSCRTM
jgi:putative transposase